MAGVLSLAKRGLDALLQDSGALRVPKMRHLPSEWVGGCARKIGYFAWGTEARHAITAGMAAVLTSTRAGEVAVRKVLAYGLGQPGASAPPDHPDSISEQVARLHGSQHTVDIPGGVAMRGRPPELVYTSGAGSKVCVFTHLVAPTEMVPADAKRGPPSRYVVNALLVSHALGADFACLVLCNRTNPDLDPYEYTPPIEAKNIADIHARVQSIYNNKAHLPAATTSGREECALCPYAYTCGSRLT